jgi:hypothetical protein
VGGVRHALDGVTFGAVAEKIHGETSEVVLTVRGLTSVRCASIVKQSLEVRGAGSIVNLPVWPCCRFNSLTPVSPALGCCAESRRCEGSHPGGARAFRNMSHGEQGQVQCAGRR